MALPLGRKTPPDFTHVEKYPLSAVTIQSTAVVFGINWYEGFDNPVKGNDGRFRISISGNVRGGHCISSEAQGQVDTFAWHQFYNQGQEGACTGFGTSRAITLHTRKTYDAFWLYDDARRIDGNYPSGEGAFVRDAFQAAKQWGDHYQNGAECQREPWRYPNQGGTSIAAYHWATNVNEILGALGLSGAQEIPLLNSWGTQYPETVYIPVNDVARLLSEEGECGVPIFRS